jgi:alkyl sulfatase BDS1-like metallo-beta-lactamase superfamily hydrolase
MATREECQEALDRLAQRLGSVDADLKRQHGLERTLSCHVPDVDTTWTGQLRDGHLHDVQPVAAPAQIKLTVSSDDLLALTSGNLSFASAWATGRLKVDAGVRDILKLRKLL